MSLVPLAGVFSARPAAPDLPTVDVGVEGADAARSGRILPGLGEGACFIRPREAGFAVVACNSCENSSGNVAGVGGGRSGLVSCDFLICKVNAKSRSLR